MNPLDSENEEDISAKFCLPKLGICKFCCEKFAVGTLLICTKVDSNTLQFSCSICKQKMLVINHDSLDCEFGGALEEVMVPKSTEEDVTLQPLPPPVLEDTYNVSLEEKVFRTLLKKQREARQSIEVSQGSQKLNPMEHAARLKRLQTKASTASKTKPSKKIKQGDQIVVLSRGKKKL
jgi:hypothetical protein